jgi:hypothetical protein
MPASRSSIIFGVLDTWDLDEILQGVIMGLSNTQLHAHDLRIFLNK